MMSAPRIRRTPFSPFRRGRVAAFLLAIILLGATLAGALAAPAGEPRATAAPPRGAARPPEPAPHAVSRSRTARPPPQPVEPAAIDRVLRYTTFIASGTPRRREVALTFDDGPSQYTEAILRILARKQVPATFFIVGQQLNHYPGVWRDELRSRAEIGDHTQSHAWLARLDPRRQADEIYTAALRIRGTVGRLPRLFRPPYGAYNRTTVKVLRSLHMLLVLWSVDPQDWREPGTGAIVQNVLANARPGAIVLLHDGGGPRDQTVAALPSIIDGLHRRHYALVSVPRLITDDPPAPNQRPPRWTGG